MPTKNCDLCGRAINVGEPYTSFDFITQRLNDDGTVVCLQGQEMTAQCVSCGYARYDEVVMRMLGVAPIESEVA